MLVAWIGRWLRGWGRRRGRCVDICETWEVRGELRELGRILRFVLVMLLYLQSDNETKLTVYCACKELLLGPFTMQVTELSHR